MRAWKPVLGQGIWIAAGLLLLAAAAAVWLLLRVVPHFASPPEHWLITPLTFLEGTGAAIMLVLAGWFGYRLLAALTLTYTLDRNGIYISWIGNRTVIPLTEVQELMVAPHAVPLPAVPYRNIGSYWGRILVGSATPLELYTTLPPARSTLIQTAHAVYAIAPREPESFVQEFGQRRALGVTQSLRPTFSEGRLFFSAFWNDPIIRTALLAGLAIVLVLFGWLSFAYANLPPTIVLGFDAAGVAQDLRPRHQILWVPLLAISFALLNTIIALSIFQRLPISARLLQIGTVPILVLFAIGTIMIATR